MAEETLAQHYVCTLDEARELVDEHDRFWVSNCGCREGKDGCDRSRIDVCLQFRSETAADGSGHREITRAEVTEILGEAETKYLVPRPFRDMDNTSAVEGICFCCDCCCWYFTKQGGEACDKGSFIELTDMDECTNCGACVEVCNFGARQLTDGELSVDRDQCYGCGLCVDVCPVECIEMVRRD